ncbi:MAG: hypothetical protein QM817_09675 [Archangium sp.]
MRTLLVVVLAATSALAAPKRVTCDTTDGSTAGRKVTLEFDQPEGGKFNAKACGFEFSAPMSIAMVNVLHQDDAGPEQLLNDKEDGAQKWVLKLAGGTLKPDAKESKSLVGSTETVYRLTGEFHGAKDAEVLVARVKVGSHNVVFMAQYPAAEAKKLRPAALAVFASTTVKIAE